MTGKKVKISMIDQEITMKNLVELTGYTYSHLCNVINGHINSVKTKKSISLALNKDFNDLWEEKTEAC